MLFAILVLYVLPLLTMTTYGLGVAARDKQELMARAKKLGWKFSTMTDKHGNVSHMSYKVIPDVK